VAKLYFRHGTVGSAKTLNLLAALSFYASLWLPVLFDAAALLMAVSFAYTLRIFLGIYAKAPELNNTKAASASWRYAAMLFSQPSGPCI